MEGVSEKELMAADPHEALMAWTLGYLTQQGVKWAVNATSPALKGDAVSALRSYYEGRASMCVDALSALQEITVDPPNRQRAVVGAERILDVLQGRRKGPVPAPPGPVAE